MRDDTVLPHLAGWRRDRVAVLPGGATFTVAPDWIYELR